MPTNQTPNPNHDTHDSAGNRYGELKPNRPEPSEAVEPLQGQKCPRCLGKGYLSNVIPEAGIWDEPDCPRCNATGIAPSQDGDTFNKETTIKESSDNVEYEPTSVESGEVEEQNKHHWHLLDIFDEFSVKVPRLLKMLEVRMDYVEAEAYEQGKREGAVEELESFLYWYENDGDAHEQCEEELELRIRKLLQT